MKYIPVTAALAALFIATACTATSSADTDSAFAYRAGRDHVGRIYHYVRTNRDGSEPEDVYVYHKSKNEIETYKMVEKCERAALVTAEIDPTLFSAVKLTGGRLSEEGTQIPFARLTFDPKTLELSANVELPDQTIAESLALESTPWFLYDFDFSDVTILAQHLSDYDRNFSLETALIWTDPSSPKFLRRLGRAEFIAEGLEGGAYRYALGGEAFPGGGTMLLDAKDGHVVLVENDVPNHAEYDDFKLALSGVDDGGEEAWRALLRAHYAECPAS